MGGPDLGDVYNSRIIDETRPRKDVDEEECCGSIETRSVGCAQIESLEDSLNDEEDSDKTPTDDY